jgi:hypothetical protein
MKIMGDMKSTQVEGFSPQAGKPSAHKLFTLVMSVLVDMFNTASVE